MWCKDCGGEDRPCPARYTYKDGIYHFINCPQLLLTEEEEEEEEEEINYVS
jgi:hypothetical protein